MKTKLLITYTFVSQLSLFGQTAFAPDFQTRPIGARALGLGEAITALVDDATAIHYNPGALGRIRGFSFIGGASGSFRLSSFETNKDAPFINDISASSKFKMSLNNISVAAAIPLSTYEVYLVPAFSYHESNNLQGFSESWSINYYDGNSYNNYQNFIFTENGGRKKISGGFGLSLGSYFSLGLSYNHNIGEKTSIITEEFIDNGSVTFENTTSTLYKFYSGSFTFGIKASTIEADEIEIGNSLSYGTGADFGISLSLPHQRKNVVTDLENLDNRYLYIQEPLRIRGGIGIRANNYLIALDASYANYTKSGYSLAFNEKSSLSQLLYFPDSLNFKGAAALSIGFEAIQAIRLGVQFRNYQYFKEDERKQPWTIAISYGLTLPIVDELLFFDISAKTEFFNRDKLLTWDTEYWANYKSVMFLIIGSIRMNLSY